MHKDMASKGYQVILPTREMREWITAIALRVWWDLEGERREKKREKRKKSGWVLVEKKEEEKENGKRETETHRFVGCVDASGWIIYDVQRQYISEITIGPLLSAIKNISSTFIRQINLEALECIPPLGSASRKWIVRVHRSMQDQRPLLKKSCWYPITAFTNVQNEILLCSSHLHFPNFWPLNC